MKVCLQAGHKGMTSGATGASGERDWTTKIVPMVATELKKYKIEVYETDAFGNKDTKVTDTDWDLFLAIHYDADIYNSRGGFTDFPDPSVDSVNAKSKSLSKKIGDYFFKTTGIPLISRSNANTKFYYMWQFLSEKTPCVLIECGIGNRKPEDYETLRKYDFIAKTLSRGILEALGVSVDDCEEKITELEKQVVDIRKSRDAWKKQCDIYEEDIKDLEKQVKTLSDQVKSLQGMVIVSKTPLTEYSTSEILKEIVSRLKNQVIKGGGNNA